MIGVIDSGVGGLSIIPELQRLMPSQPITYIGDSAWCPYGPRPVGEIRQRVQTLTEYLIDAGASIIVLACNSATIHAVEAMRATFPIHFVGMEPAVKPAASISQSGVIGLLATEASLAGEKLHRLISEHASLVRVITQPCPEFVTLIEGGQLSGATVEAAAKRVISPLIDEGADVLILGCSHYPFIRNSIQKVAGDQVRLLDTGAPVARRVQSLLEADTPVSSGLSGALRIFTTGNVAHWQNLVPRLHTAWASQPPTIQDLDI